MERTRESFAEFDSSRFPGGSFFRRVTPESERPQYHYWGDAHFLLLAVAHVCQAIRDLPAGGLPEPDERVRRLRNLLEHWSESRSTKLSWGEYKREHGEFASPWNIEFDAPGAAGADIRIGSDRISLNELETFLRDILTALIAAERET